MEEHNSFAGNEMNLGSLTSVASSREGWRGKVKAEEKVWAEENNIHHDF